MKQWDKVRVRTERKTDHEDHEGEIVDIDQHKTKGTRYLVKFDMTSVEGDISESYQFFTEDELTVI